MTIDEAIKRIKEYMIINKMNEPQAIFISEALCIAIEALDKSKWKSVKDDLPKDEREVLVKLVHTYADDDYYEYSIARYIEARDKQKHWFDDKRNVWLEWDRYSSGCGGSPWYKVIEWKEI